MRNVDDLQNATHKDLFDETVCALRADHLQGPWILANISTGCSKSEALYGGLNVALACDSFCPMNILSERIVRAAGLSVCPGDSRIYGVGDGQLNLVGSTTADVCIGQTTKSVTFQVSPDVEGFAFFSFPEQCRWGFTLDTTQKSISFEDDVVPYYRSKDESLKSSRLATIRAEDSKAPRVVLEQSVVVPPSGSGEGYLTKGRIVGDFDTTKDLYFEPTNLKTRYGMMGPRIVQKVG